MEGGVRGEGLFNEEEERIRGKEVRKKIEKKGKGLKGKEGKLYVMSVGG